jgi:hypothetical protein
VKAGESELVDPARVHNIRPQAARRFGVCILQLRLEVEKNENWMEVAANIGRTMGPPEWCQLWIYPTDNQITKLGTEDSACSFDWEEDKQ